jgi:hypothetical protein
MTKDGVMVFGNDSSGQLGGTRASRGDHKPKLLLLEEECERNLLTMATMQRPSVVDVDEDDASLSI